MPMGVQALLLRFRSLTTWHLLLACLTAAAYFLTALLGYALQIHPAGAALWPPAGLLLGLLLIAPRRLWPVLLLGAMSGNLLADLNFSSRWFIAIPAAILNATESLFGAWLIERLVGGRVTLRRIREFGALLLGGVVIAPALAAFGGSLVISRGSGADYWWQWFVWWAGDGLGVLLVTPCILAWHARTTERWAGFRLPAAAGLLIAIGLTAWLVIQPDPGTPVLLDTVRFLVFPLLLLSALAFGLRGATTAVLVVGLIIGLKGSAASGIFTQAGEPPTNQLIDVFGYLALIAVTTLVPAVLLAEREVDRRELRERAARFSEMADNIHEAYFTIDLETGEPLYFNSSWETVWGLPAELGRSLRAWQGVLHPDDAEVLDRALALARHGESLDTRVRLREAGGIERRLWLRTYPVTSNGSAVRRMIGVARDITELSVVEQARANSERLESIGHLAGGIAHDFNNILSVVIADADLLRQETSDPEHMALLDEIGDAAERAATITRQLLLFARQQPVQVTTLDINQVLRGMHSMLKRLLPESIRFELGLSSAPALVVADRGQLTQVFINLAVNARDAMPDGGSLRIGASTRSGTGSMAGDRVVVEVADTGPGIPKELQSRIFEPFFTTKGPGRGTGLGLATSQSIVAAAGGTLTVHSIPGHGTTFRIELPLVEMEEAPSADVAAPRVPEGRERILLVEDDAAVRRVASRVLRSLGYEVVETVESHEAVIRGLEHPPIDLLLTDVVMPGLSGTEVARQLRERLPTLPVLLVSGYTDLAAVEELLAQPGISLLSKPYSKTSLAVAVRELLDARESQ